MAATTITIYALTVGPLWLAYVATALVVGSCIADPPTWLPWKRS